MVSITPPTSPSLKWFSDEIPAKFGALISVFHQLSTFLWTDSGFSIISFVMYSAGTFLAITLPAWIFLYFRKYKKINEPAPRAADLPPVVNARSQKTLATIIVDDAYSGGIIEDIATAADVAQKDALAITDTDYAEEIQFQEMLLASFFTSELEKYNPSSSKQRRAANTEPMNLEEGKDSSKNFCGICLESKESWLMFANDTCHHSFCYDCTTSHITAKIQDKVRHISCPAPNCNSVLDFEACRLIIPSEAIVKWDELLCMSLIPESQKLYCPYRDCSALLVNDLQDMVTETKCVVCSRWFCAECGVPWHVDFTCKEFRKLEGKKGGRVDKMVKVLAKKKRWQKCPKCKMYVEKSEGCVHITCRCKYEFCYRCGSKWSDSHGNCRPRS